MSTDEIAPPPPETDGPVPVTDPGAELEKVNQYVQIWRYTVRLEYLTLVAIGVFAVTVAAAFVILDLGEDDITGGWGYPILWVISFLRASSVLLPIPGSGLTIAAGAVMNPLGGIPVPIAVGVTAGTAESLGEFTGYYAGVNGGKLMEGRKIYELIRRWLQKAPFPTMLFMSFMPSPLFDVAGLAAGAARIPIRIFYPAILTGKVCRGILMAAAGYYGSELIQDILDVLEGQAARDFVGTTEGKAAAAIVAIVALGGGYYVYRRFKSQISEWL